MEAKTTAPIGSVSLSATVTRANGTVEELGVIAYWHKRWWRRTLWRLTHKT